MPNLPWWAWLLGALVFVALQTIVKTRAAKKAAAQAAASREFFDKQAAVEMADQAEARELMRRAVIALERIGEKQS